MEFVHDARTSHWEFYLQRIPSTRLLAPRERLDGMCFQQFMMVDTYFSRFLITKKEEFLDRMVASLYLKENERFALSFESAPSLFKRNPVLLNMEKRLPVIRALSKEIKFALFLNFILIKRWLGAAYPHLFPQAEEEEKESQRKKNKKEQKKQVTTNWLEIFDSFVGDNIPQAEKYQIMPVMDAFRILNRKIRDAKKHNH
ncbi:hypothetical protein EZS27_024833 [termite gut metagenome]|uniref:Uncharacterized protein n=1 Tax=termite gut metagenome TaxID=433724 RepID=A0A5J4QYI9_9ZZZZ